MTSSTKAAKPGHSPRHGGVLSLAPFNEIVGVSVADPEGLIVIPFRDMPLVCRVNKWVPGPLDDITNTLELIWRVGGIDVVAASREFTEAEYVAEPDPISLSVPAHFMLDFDAVIELRYRVKQEGNPDVDSPHRNLRIDRNAPVFLLPSATPSFVDPDITASGITEAVLLANEFIEIRIPDFATRAGEDQISVYLSDETPPFPLIHTVIRTLSFIDEDLIIRVHRDFFRALPNGTNYMTGRAYDRSGNFSPLSASAGFTVNLIAMPSDLQPPEIRPPAYIDNLLKRDDARAGIAALIPGPYTGFLVGDEVEVIWAGRPVLPPVAITHFPFPVLIPWTILRIPGPLIREQVPVRYRIHRAGHTPFPSLSNLFWVDFTIAGQDHAAAPALRNATLERVQVVGLGSGLTNELDLRDRDLGARVWVRLYLNPQPGEVLALYWGNRGPVAYYTVQPGDVTNQLVQFLPDVSGADIVGEGNNPALPVWYSTSNGVNEQHSPDTSVNVHVDPLIQFAAPRISHTLHGGASYLTCESRPATCHGVRWHVPADTRMRPDDELRFYWQGYLTNNWENAIAGTDFEVRVTIRDEHLSGGVPIVVLPWDTKIEPMRDKASATAQCYLFRGGSLIGESATGRIKIDRVSPASGRICQPGDVGFCDGTDLKWLDTEAGTSTAEVACVEDSHEADLAAQLHTLRKRIKKLIKTLRALKFVK